MKTEYLQNLKYVWTELKHRWLTFDFILKQSFEEKQNILNRIMESEYRERHLRAKDRMNWSEYWKAIKTYKIINNIYE